MKVFNVRFGLATNSSSSHSIIFLKQGVQALDFPSKDETEDFGYFGWDFFTAASKEAKLRYLGIFLRDRLQEQLPTGIVDVICKNWLDGVVVEGADYVDHQSWHYLPSAFNSKVPDEDFFAALKTYFMNEQLVVLGGNDNSQLKHALDDGRSFVLPIPRDCGRNHNFICRHDEQYDYWTIFNQADGRKIRLRFTTDPKQMMNVPNKATAPELVDMKITNYCPFACKFCYQSSTVKGNHAYQWDVWKLVQGLSQLKVFEVALGGGEPTFHPDFVEILKNFRDYGIVPNFTTKNLSWLRDPRQWKPIMDFCGAFAFSATEKDEIEQLCALLDYNGIAHDKCVIHFVMGTMDKYKFKQMLTCAAERLLSVTLLGYKNYGFGQDYSPVNHDWWIEESRSVREGHSWQFNLAIDTVLAAKYQEQIEAANVPSWMYDVKEGSFSCYIDAVEEKIGPSSFCDSHEMIDFKDLRGEGRYVGEAEMIKEAFKYF
jgi:organic radical activating enzyme